MTRIIGLKVDVDTCEGMKRGVPKLAALFKKHGVRASFFVPMGKDHTGWTAKRVFTRRGFMSKAGRVGVVSTYGVKTLMYGLLLPGPNIALKNAPLLRSLAEEGHDVGIHGLDHVYWHDHIKGMSGDNTRNILTEAVSTYRRIMGSDPHSFAAPGWMINQHALAFFEENGFTYSSDVRGKTIFLPKLAGRTFKLPQVPTTLPTLDEAVGLKGSDQESLARFFVSSLTDGINILTVHAELEGKNWAGFLESVLTETKARGFRYERLDEIVAAVQTEGPLPVHEIGFGFVEGRAGEVALEKF
ncbi:MAG TPA: polysaccharide deacetylase family protein [Syntrophorhabdales bacterium]|nr:polysaccharide deacetylase family protein [Syntrophorhabdales bacterium]